MTELRREQNLLLDFSHVYPEGIERQAEGLKRINLSDISGTDMYCTREAADEIRKRLKDWSPRGIHFLDSGNYHYVTLFFAEKIHIPFSLVLFDHHTDMQEPMFPQLLSCGSWAGELLRRSRYLEQMILIGPEEKSIEGIDQKLRDRIIWLKESDRKLADEERKKINLSLPIYVSIDKDVLSPRYARTNWNQGNMSVNILENILLEVFWHQDVIGVDICGECSLLEPLQQLSEDEKVNGETNRSLYQFLSRLFGWERKN